MFRYLQTGGKSRDFLEVLTVVIPTEYRCITFDKEESIVWTCPHRIWILIVFPTAYVSEMSSPLEKINRSKKKERY